MARIKTAHAITFNPENLAGIERVEITADLLVIGGGNAGCFVATEAAKINSKLKVIIAEKADIRRSGACSAGMDYISIKVNSKLLKTAVFTAVLKVYVT